MSCIHDYLVWHRLLCLCLTILIIFFSLYEYSLQSKPVYIYEQDTSFLISQVMLDRRLISTLVASQPSLFCPILLMPDDSKKAFKVTISLGLAMGWVISILFDLKTMIHGSLLVHCAKYLQVLFFLIEAFVTVFLKERTIELSFDEKI